MIDFLDFFFSGDNIIFNHVDLLPTENCLPCAWYDISGNFISAADGLNIIAEIDEQTFKITKQYIDYCIIPVPAGASSCKLSGLANGRADIRIQTSLSEAIKDLQSKPEPAPLVLTNPSPLPCTDGKKILGIHAKGKSEQKTTQTLATVQGSMPSTAIGDAINSAVASTHQARCCSNVVYLTSGVSLNITSGYEIFTMYSTSADGNITANSGGWESSKTLDANGYYRFQIRKADNSDIAPSMFTLTASNVKPTPTNPIPIVDASGDVTAHTKNMFDPHYGIHSTSTGFGFYANTVGCSDKLLPCVPGEKYKLSMDEWYGSTRWVGYYDGDGNMIVREPNPTVITIPSGAKYFFVSVYAGNITETSYPGHIQLEKGEIATSYVPYQSNSVYLPFEPKSVGSVANEFIIYEDGTGKIIQRMGTMTTADFKYYVSNGGTNSNRCVLNTDNVFLDKTQIAMCDGFVFVSGGNTAIGNDDRVGIFAFRDDQKGFTFRIDKSISTADDVKNYFKEKAFTIYYPLPTPIEKTLTAEEVAAVRQLMTYKGTTTIESEMDVVSVTYSGDVKSYVDAKTDYSYTDTIIGKWADGKDLHRMVIQATTPSIKNDFFTIATLDNADVKKLDGLFSVSSGAKIGINTFMYDGAYIATYITNSGEIKMRTSIDGYLNRPCEIIVEYTLKDSAPAAASVMSLDDNNEEETIIPSGVIVDDTVVLGGGK